jgi:hypothetical protein
VRPEIWARTEELTDPTTRRLSCHLEGGARLEVPIRHTAAGEMVAGLRDREIAVFLAGDADALAASVARYLIELEFLSHQGEMRVEAAVERPAESLDPDTIWTHTELDTSSTETDDREVIQT